jgi:hypothetical protein
MIEDAACVLKLARTLDLDNRSNQRLPRQIRGEAHTHVYGDVAAFTRLGSGLRGGGLRSNSLGLAL